MKMRISKEALFKVMSTRFGLRTVENSIENPHFIFCSSFQNPRLGSMKLAIRDLHVSVFAYRTCDRLAPLTVNGESSSRHPGPDTRDMVPARRRRLCAVHWDLSL